MINVVAAIIINKEGKILITQRNFKKSQGGLWEFPGGKIKPDDIPTIIEAKDSTKAGKTLPPQGLMLLNVEYD